MVSETDSEGSVQFVKGEERGEVSVCEPKGASSGRNFCIEKNGIRQPIPSSTTKPSASGSDESSALPNSHRSKRIESEGEPRGPKPKRPRQSQAREVNTDPDVVEVRETPQVAPRSQAFPPTTDNHHRKRSSARLQQKREKRPEFNYTALKEDRMKREKKPRPAAKGCVELLDDDEEKRQVNDANEQSSFRNGGTERPRKVSQTSGHGNEVVSVEEQAEEEEDEGLLKQSKDTGAVDAPYTGSTQLIFEFPPGERGKIRVTEEERGRLCQRKYLNDSLIDFYIKYHESDIERRAEELRIRATFFSSFFFGRLRRTEPIDYDGVKGWTKKVDIFTKQFVFVPICDSYHWSLIIVANLDKLKRWVDRSEEVSQSSSAAPRIIYLDSLDPKRGTEFGETMRHYLVEEWVAKRLGMEGNAATRKATSATFKKVIPILRPTVPIQTNEYDCGLYLLNSFEMFLHNTDGLRDRLLSGTRDLRDVYSHVEITMLRKSIINLMDILEHQWVSEQLQRKNEFMEHLPDGVKDSTTEENIRSGLDIPKGSLHENIESAEKLEDGSIGSLALRGRKADVYEENFGSESNLMSVDKPEYVSMLDTGAGHNRLLEKRRGGDVNMNREAAPDAARMDKQAVHADPRALPQSHLSSVPMRYREESYEVQHSAVEAGRRKQEDPVTNLCSEVEEVPSRQHDADLRQAQNSSGPHDNEVVEVGSRASSIVNSRRMGTR